MGRHGYSLAVAKLILMLASAGDHQAPPICVRGAHTGTCGLVCNAQPFLRVVHDDPAIVLPVHALVDSLASFALPDARKRGVAEASRSPMRRDQIPIEAGCGEDARRSRLVGPIAPHPTRI